MTKGGRRVHVAFWLAGWCLCALVASTSWRADLIVTVCLLTLTLAGVLGAVAAAAWDLLYGRRPWWRGR